MTKRTRKKAQIKIDDKNNASKKAKKTLKKISEFTPEKGYLN